MQEDLKYPNIEAVKTILSKIGVDPETRDLDCQDYEYTTCLLEELPNYIDLYQNIDTSMREKRVLGCYILECLNQFIVINDKEHPQQDVAFELLYADIEIHKSELAYFGKTEEHTEQERWPIAKYLSNWINEK